MKSGLGCLKSLNGPVHLQDLLVRRGEAPGDVAPAQLWALPRRVRDEGQHRRGVSPPVGGQNPTVFLKYRGKISSCPPVRGRAEAGADVPPSSELPGSTKCDLQAAGMRTQPISRISEFDGITLSFPNTNTT